MEIKKNYLLILIAMFSSLALLSQKKYNLDFNEFNPNEQTVPTGWFKWGGFEQVTGEKLTEDNTVGKVTSDKKSKFGCITYRIPANYVGDTIRLMGKIKHENVKGYVGLLIRIDGYTTGDALAFANMQNQKIKGTSAWKEYSIALNYPSNAKTIFIGGILSGKGTAWFDDFQVTIDDNDIQTLKETPEITLKNFDNDALKQAVNKSSQMLDLSGEEALLLSLDSLIAEIGNKRIVAIGESTHGTSEFYKMRRLITKQLIEEKGFNTVVLESPYDDIELLTQNLDNGSLDSLMRKHLFSIYQTQEMKSFLEWYKANRSKYDIQFKGCDDSYWAYLELLKRHMSSIKDNELNSLMLKLESNISKKLAQKSFRKEIQIGSDIYENIQSIQDHLKSTQKLTEPIEEILFNIKTSYINYVNIKNDQPIQSRDEIMADRISFLAENPDNKIIVWAHNAHISKQVIVDNEIGLMGHDLKKEFGNSYYAIGLSTSSGSYSYIDQKLIYDDHDYTEKLKTANLLPNEAFSWENALALKGNSFYTNLSILNKELGTNEIIGPTKLIGYSKESKADIYYLPLTKHFDALIFIEKTNATTPIYD